MRSRFGFAFAIVLVFLFPLTVTSAWSQKGGGGGRAPSGGPTTIPHSGGGFGGPPSMSTSNSGPSAEDEQKVEFSSTTVLVQVPVVVTDKSGAHLHNLKKEDFQVFENGKEQKLGAFEEITTASSPLPQPASVPGVFSNLAVDPSQPRTLAIIAIDEINTPFLDQAYGRKELIKYLSANLEPGQIVGLVIMGSKGIRVLHGLTTDSAQLIAAVKKINGELSTMETYDPEAQVAAANQAGLGTSSNFTQGAEDDIEDQLRDFVTRGDAITGAFQQQAAIETTLRSFLDIANYVSGIPGRKSLIWATGSFPFSIQFPSSVPGGWLSMLYERTMTSLNQAQMSVYPVDIRGLVSTSPMGDVNYNGGHSGSQMLTASVGRSWLQASTIDTLRDFAEMTGGKAFYNTNDLAGSFHKAVDDASSYYLLGYYLDTQNNKPGWRQLKVKVNAPHGEIRARNGFFVTNATMNPGITRTVDEQSAIQSPFDATSLPVTLRWLGNTPDGDKRRVDFSIFVPNGVYIDEAAQNRFNLDLAAVVTNDKGETTKTFAQPLQGAIRPEALAIVKAEGIHYKTMMELPPGQYMVKLVVRDNLSGRIGSVSAPLTVN
jgi:VWFA-related protein